MKETRLTERMKHVLLILSGFGLITIAYEVGATPPSPFTTMVPQLSLGGVEEVLAEKLGYTNDGRVVKVALERFIRSGANWIAASSEQDVGLLPQDKATGHRVVPFRLTMSLAEGYYEVATLAWVSLKDVTEPLGEWHVNHVRITGTGVAEHISAEEYTNRIYAAAPCPMLELKGATCYFAPQSEEADTPKAYVPAVQEQGGAQ